MLTVASVTQRLSNYGEIILQCNVYIKQRVRHSGNSSVLKYTCALLNSGGGLLKLCNVEHGKQTQAKHLDTWWSGMENLLVGIVSSDDICNYFDLVGNHDDPELYLFVRMGKCLCALDYNARLPTETATHDVTYQSALNLLSKSCGVAQDGLRNLPPIPQEFQYKVTNPSLKREGKRTQFKQLSNPKGTGPGPTSFPSRICEMMVKYVSAFANHDGGRVYFGIEDDLAAVIGEEMTEELQQRTVKQVSDRMEHMIWGDRAEKPVRGRHWDIEFRPVAGCPDGALRVVVIISICQFSGGVFISCPESFYVESGDVVGFRFDHWKNLMLNSTLDIPPLRAKFMKVNMPVPNPRLVFTLPDTVAKIQDKFFQASTEPVLRPRDSIDHLPGFIAQDQVHSLLERLGAAADFVAIDPHAWGICLPDDGSSSVGAMLLISGPTIGLHIIAFGTGPQKPLADTARRAAIYVKQGIAMNGACLEKFFIMCHTVNFEASGWQSSVVDSMMAANQGLPADFAMEVPKHQQVMHSLVFWMAMYKSYSTREDLPEHYFTLTLEQFELLWTRQYMNELWVDGLAGSGKTLVAVLLMRELRRRGCRKEEILYLVENEALCAFIGSFDLALTVCRRPFLSAHQTLATFDTLYGQVKNVVVDEAHNFKDRDGDWYSIVESLVSRWNAPGSCMERPEECYPSKRLRIDCTDQKSPLLQGYIWVFMDQAGKVHRFSAGLPDFTGKNTFTLNQVTRGTGETCSFALKFLDCGNRLMNDKSSHVTHRLQGNPVKVIKSEESSAQATLLSVLTALQEEGVKLSDTAVLLGKQRDLQPLQEELNTKLGEQNPITGESVRVDSVKRFSGLEKPVIIGLNLNVNEQTADFNKFVASLVSRATQDVVIITPREIVPPAPR